MNIHVSPCKLNGKIRAISSKSDVHRILFASALANGNSTVSFTSLSADISASIAMLRTLGAIIDIEVASEGYVASVQGISEVNKGCVLNASECGTAARLILPVAAALGANFTLVGAEGLTKRPFSELCNAIRCGGTSVSSDVLPITVSGKLCGGDYKIRGDISSQYISGLLFALPLLKTDSKIILTTPLVSAGYVDMTLDTLKKFGITVKKTDYGFYVTGRQKYVPCHCTAEGDWSNAGYFLAAGALGGRVTVTGLDLNSRQRDREILSVLSKAGANVSCESNSVTVSGATLHSADVSGTHFPDALPMIASLLSVAEGTSIITGGARLKIKESNRLSSTAEMINCAGGDVTVTEDGFIINGKALSGGDASGENDHRIVMSAAVLATASETGITIHGADAVNKSYPEFFNDFKLLGGKCNVVTDR